MRLLLVATICLGAASASAQTHLGVRVHAVSVWQDASVNADGAFRGLGVSAFAERALTPVLAAELDLGYSQSGFDDFTIGRRFGPNGERIITTIDVKSRAHLATATATLAVRRPRGIVRPYAFAGPRVDLVVRETLERDGQSGDADAYSTLGLGASGGLGVAFPTTGGGGELRLDARASRVRVVAFEDGEWAGELRAGFRF